MQINSLEHQWLQFLASENSCLLETARDKKVYLAQNLIGVFSSFKETLAYLAKNPDLLDLDDIGFIALKSYDGKEYIQLYSEILEDENPSIPQAQSAIKADISYPDKNLYFKAIEKCQKHIYEGDIYQANLCHKFDVNIQEDLELPELKERIYSRLRELNPANYMALSEFEDWIIFSSSPESFLKINFDEDFVLRTTPIKGTAKLGESLEELKNDKESAEHIMIVDLIRNDFGKIAQTGSVSVENLLQDTQHTNLQHLESTIKSTLLNELVIDINGLKIPNFAGIFNALAPGGSITGAPKIRSMQIIDELESNPRGPFTGNLGFYKFKEQKGEFNILIRSIFFNKKTNDLFFNTGAGITSASNAQKEYEETLLKAQKLIEVFDAI